MRAGCEEVRIEAGGGANVKGEALSEKLKLMMRERVESTACRSVRLHGRAGSNAVKHAHPSDRLRS